MSKNKDTEINEVQELFQKLIVSKVISSIEPLVNDVKTETGDTREIISGLLKKNTGILSANISDINDQLEKNTAKQYDELKSQVASYKSEMDNIKSMISASSNFMVKKINTIAPDIGKTYKDTYDELSSVINDKSDEIVKKQEDSIKPLEEGINQVNISLQGFQETRKIENETLINDLKTYLDNSILEKMEEKKYEIISELGIQSKKIEEENKKNFKILYCILVINIVISFISLFI